MGFFSSIMSGMGKMVGEQLWPTYQEAVMKDSYTLQKIIENETNIMRKSVYLLALSERDRYKAKELYEEEKTRYNNTFNNLKNYRKFVEVIDMFMRKCG